MGKPPEVVAMNGETGARNGGMFNTYFDEHHITIHITKSLPTVAEICIGTFKGYVVSMDMLI